MANQIYSGVYVIADNIDGPCKIGRARDVVKRLGELQTGNHKGIIYLSPEARNEG